MVSAAVQIIPHVGVSELLAAAVGIESMGYESLWLSDEGFMTDPFVALGPIAGVTSRIELGVVTNPYTRHPAMTTAAIATLDELSGGRAALCFVAGGSLVLDPIAMERSQPLATVREAITVTRMLLAGESVNWEGSRFTLRNARLDRPVRAALPIHVAARGEKMLAMGAREADAVWTGLENVSAVRAASEGRPIKLLVGDTPPINSALAGPLKQAVEQDGDTNSRQPETMAEWGARIRSRSGEFDQLLIVTWESCVDTLLATLRAVKEALS